MGGSARAGDQENVAGTGTTTTVLPSTTAEHIDPPSTLPLSAITTPPAARATLPPTTSPPAITVPPEPAFHTPPTVSISCPDSNFDDITSLSVKFGHQTTAGDSKVVRWNIDYGDGKKFSSATESAVFAHTYTTPGSYIVTGTATDANSRSGEDVCVFVWSPIKAYTPPTVSTPAVPSVTTPVIGGTSGGSCSSGSYINIDGQCIAQRCTSQHVSDLRERPPV